jgi:hypothetical protein
VRRVLALLVVAALAALSGACTTTQKVASGAAVGGVTGFALGGPVGAGVGAVIGGAAVPIAMAN